MNESRDRPRWGWGCVLIVEALLIVSYALMVAASGQDPAEDAITEGDVTIECGDDCIEFVEGVILYPAGFQIVIGNRKWAEITPDGNVVCYNTLEQPEDCDCTKMLIAYMASTMNR